MTGDRILVDVTDVKLTRDGVAISGRLPDGFAFGDVVGMSIDTGSSYSIPLEADGIDLAGVVDRAQDILDASRSDRRCDWCRGAIPAGSRRDAITCSKRCRQARHRFHSDVAAGRPVAPHRGETAALNLAYADPPYPGMSRRYYADHPDFDGEVDHADLIRRLSTFDGWALSTNASSLQAMLALCPPGVRVAAWARGERPNQQAGVPLNAWEPVIFHGGRRHPSRSAGVRRTDVLVHHSRPRLTDPARVIGSKPAAFIRWMFDLLGAEPQDSLTDLFPGSGGVHRAWTVFSAPPNP